MSSVSQGRATLLFYFSFASFQSLTITFHVHTVFSGSAGRGLIIWEHGNIVEMRDKVPKCSKWDILPDLPVGVLPYMLTKEIIL